MKRRSLLDPAFPVLKAFIVGHTGLAYYVDKDEDLAARIDRRLDATGAHDCRRYLSLLSSAGAEMECLIGELTIGETYFFRQVEHFDLLRELVLPLLLRHNAPTRRLRIWSAGCATGEEPYSIAILLEREFQDRLRDWDVTVLATDINHEFLDRARAARYSEWSFRATPHHIRAACFTRHGKIWQLNPEYRKRVVFQHLNLADNNQVFLDEEAFDLIFCRNVMIYFSRELIAQTIGRFWNVLRPGGWFFAGHAEFDADAFARFARVQLNDASVYQRPPAVTLPPEPLRLPAVVSGPERIPPVRKPASPYQPPAPPVNGRLHTGPSLEQVRELADRGAWHAAADLGRQLTAREPLSAAAHFTLGLILESTLSGPEASEALRRAIYLDRGFVLAHYHLATCLQTEGDHARARKSFQNALQLMDELAPGQRLEHADGLTVADLRDMARLHMEMLDERGKAN